jgi:Tol biopolymer transport system component
VSAHALAYQTEASVLSDIVERDRRGQHVRTLAAKAQQSALALSPDGKWIALSRRNARSWNIWVLDVTRDVISRFTMSEGQDSRPHWSPNAEAIGYGTNRSNLGTMSTFAAKSRASAAEEKIIATGFIPVGWTRDPAIALCMNTTNRGPGESTSVFRCPLDGGTPQRLTDIGGTAAVIQASPDGEWILYSTTESGRPQVYARRLREGTRSFQISSERGTSPRWRRDMKEVYYLEGTRLMAVAVEVGDSVVIGTPQLLFEAPALQPSEQNLPFDTLDGQRFFLNERREVRNNPITVRLGWSRLLQEPAPSGR